MMKLKFNIENDIKKEFINKGKDFQKNHLKDEKNIENIKNIKTNKEKLNLKKMILYSEILSKPKCLR